MDAPSAKRRSARGGDENDQTDEPQKVRSLSLTSRELGLTATLDLARISETRAVPVEYRKGRPRRIYDAGDSSTDAEDDGTKGGVEPWPTDRIQLGLQVLLLESAGYDVPQAVLYYAAVRRRIDVAVDDDLRREALDPLDSVSAATRRNQVRQFDRSERCLELAQALIAAKIRNQRKLLMRNHNQLPAIVTDGLAQQIQAAEKGLSIDAIRGHEGQAAGLYFDHFGGMIKSEAADEFDTNGRQRRPPPDPVNACLSFAYTMLTHECTAALRTARLEPSIGAFHVSRPGRPSMSLDLMEPFRPLISDSLTIAAFNRGELKEGHFQRTAAGCLMTAAGRKAFFGIYGRRMSEEVTHPVFGYKLSYRRMLVLHARMIAAWINGEIPTLSFLTTR